MPGEETGTDTDPMPNGKARQYTSGGQRLAGPGFHQISGLAWSGRGRVARVGVSTDGGRTWAEARLQDPVLPRDGAVENVDV